MERKVKEDMSKHQLFLYNSLGRELQEFQSIQPGKVRMYTCGPTVYNYAHIGNLRAYLFTDTLRRVLQWKGYDVYHVMNITDVGHLTSDEDEGEDKMELAALREGKSIWDIAQFYTDAFKKNLEELNILPPSHWCNATDHIREMINFAKELDQKGFTYVLEDGLYFDTSKLKNYGKLALLDLEGQKEGARVQTSSKKRNPSDFAVWRFSPKDKKRLMEWNSPWGVGAPGWHLECSCMSIKYLGERFDIHTGGIDHRQVHHCNEIAQNQAYLGDLDDPRGGVNYWLHNEFVVLQNEKMSKSTGNFIRLETLVEKGIHPLVYRFFALNATYRTPLIFNYESLQSAKKGLVRLLEQVKQLKQGQSLDWLKTWQDHRYSRGGSFDDIIEELMDPLTEKEREWVDKLDEAISRDLNIPQALSHLFLMLDESNIPADSLLRLIGIYDLVLGLNLLETEPGQLNIRPIHVKLSEEEIESLIQQRSEARKKGNYRLADQIRDQLIQEGIQIKDTPKGTQWEYNILV